MGNRKSEFFAKNEISSNFLQPNDRFHLLLGELPASYDAGERGWWGKMATSWKLAVIGIMAVMVFFIAQTPDRLPSTGTWSVECAIEGETDRRDCEIGVDLKSFNPPYYLGLIYRPTRGSFLALGLPAPSRVIAWVDRGKAHHVVKCTGKACVLTDKAAATLLQEMSRGGTLHLLFQGSQAEVAIAQVPLGSFNHMRQEALSRSGH